MPATPRPAATLMLIRDGAEGLEVLMMRRSESASFVAGAYVFPGGVLDDDDGRFPVQEGSDLDEPALCRRMRLAEGARAYGVAAIRECFEESGVLLACDRDGELVETGSAGEGGKYEGWRARLNAGEAGLAELCGKEGVRLCLDRLVYCGHWITPLCLPRRYDTRFFLAEAPPGQTAAHDHAETIDTVWLRPAEALDRHRRGEIDLVFATTRMLAWLSDFPHATAALAAARAREDVPTHMPHMARSAAGLRPLIPGHGAYAEVRKLDPEGQAGASCEIVPGREVRLSPTVRRVTAPNPGISTGPGTNSYLLGAGDDLAVVDPGPDDPAHLERLLELGEGRIRTILLTHGHPDHAGCAAALAARTGAAIWGMPADAKGTPLPCPLHRALADGETVIAGEVPLRAVHTPGHVFNHLCFVHGADRLLFSGDHLMQGSTVVIIPPDGEMAAYLRSLRKIQAEDVDHIAPGHGFLMDEPARVVERVLAHRQKREDRILAVLRARGPSFLSEMLAHVYADVPENRHRLAERSLTAHLVKLRDEGHAILVDGRWELSDRGKA